MNERIKMSFLSQVKRIQDMIRQPKLSLSEINELYKRLGMMRMADIILRHDFQDESMHAKYDEIEAALQKAAKKAELQASIDFQRSSDMEDVISYADNEYGECSDPDIAEKVRKNAEEIARDYRHALDNDDCWFYLLESSIENWLEDNKEVSGK